MRGRPVGAPDEQRLQPERLAARLEVAEARLGERLRSPRACMLDEDEARAPPAPFPQAARRAARSRRSASRQFDRRADVACRKHFPYNSLTRGAQGGPILRTCGASALVLATLLAFGAVLVTSAVRPTTTGRSRSRAPTGSVQVRATGAVIGRITGLGTLRITDSDTSTGGTLQLYCPDGKVDISSTTPDPDDKTIALLGSNIRFRIVGGSFRFTASGGGINLSVVGKGHVVLDGRFVPVRAGRRLHRRHLLGERRRPRRRCRPTRRSSWTPPRRRRL